MYSNFNYCLKKMKVILKDIFILSAENLMHIPKLIRNYFNNLSLANYMKCKIYITVENII